MLAIAMIAGVPLMMIIVLTCMMTLALFGLAKHHLHSNYRVYEIRKNQKNLANGVNQHDLRVVNPQAGRQGRPAAPR